MSCCYFAILFSALTCAINESSFIAEKKKKDHSIDFLIAIIIFIPYYK